MNTRDDDSLSPIPDIPEMEEDMLIAQPLPNEDQSNLLYSWIKQTNASMTKTNADIDRLHQQLMVVEANTALKTNTLTHSLNLFGDIHNKNLRTIMHLIKDLKSKQEALSLQLAKQQQSINDIFLVLETAGKAIDQLFEATNTPLNLTVNHPAQTQTNIDPGTCEQTTTPISSEQTNNKTPNAQADISQVPGTLYQKKRSHPDSTEKEADNKLRRTQ